jgi:signal transduction histidine kinase
MSKSLAKTGAPGQLSTPTPVLTGTAVPLPALPRDQRQVEQSAAERTAQLEETIAELEAFSYSVSHDLRSSLRVMQNYARGLMDDYGSKLDAEGIAVLGRMQGICERLERQIRDLLLYSRIAKSQMELKQIPLGPLIEDLLEHHPELRPMRGCFKVEHPLHTVKGNEAYLVQCFSNLVGNALKFVKPDSVPDVRIRSERTEGRIRVWVSDNGIGIAPDQHHRIFQLFGRIHPESVYPGTGLGLAIVKKAISRMGGETGFRSELGRGSEFWFTLPEAQ